MKSLSDPRGVAGKPHATTEDQISEMESEGQGQTSNQPDKPEAVSEHPAAAPDAKPDIDPAETGSDDEMPT